MENNNSFAPTEEEKEEARKTVEDIMNDAQASYEKKEMPQHLLDTVSKFENIDKGYEIEEIDPFA